MDFQRSRATSDDGQNRNASNRNRRKNRFRQRQTSFVTSVAVHGLAAVDPALQLGFFNFVAKSYRAEGRRSSHCPAHDHPWDSIQTIAETCAIAQQRRNLVSELPHAIQACLNRIGELRFVYESFESLDFTDSLELGFPA
jgi:hypothetical protein